MTTAQDAFSDEKLRIGLLKCAWWRVT